MKRFVSFLLSIISTLFPAQATQTDSLQVSLLTVMPHDYAIYTVYGHTALRLYNPKQNINTVFNWGTFDFNAPGFVYRFLKGETDYFLSTHDYSQFIQCYHAQKATVIEQILYIPSEGKDRLLQMLSLNLQPENRTYRYNFLKDNCTTRVRDLIEKVTDNPLNIPDTHSSTFRQLIHSCTYPYPWMTFGIDLLIGSEADQPINNKQDALFLPMQLKETLDSTFYDSGNALVASSHTILQSNCQQTVHSSFWNSPMQIGWLIFCIYGTAIALTEMYKHQTSKKTFGISKIMESTSAFLFFIVAIAGCLLVFFTLFSCHPCTSSNWNLLWLHPLHFIASTGYYLKRHFRLITIYHWCNLILLSILLLGKSGLPQNLNPATVPYILCLISASLFYLINNNVHKKIKRIT